MWLVRVSERSGGWNHQFCLHKVGYSKRFGGWMLKSTDIFVADVYNLDPYLCMFRLESSWIINALQPGWRWFVIAQDWDERDEKKSIWGPQHGDRTRGKWHITVTARDGILRIDLTTKKSTYSRHRKLGSAPVHSISSFTERVVRATYDAIQLDELY